MSFCNMRNALQGGGLVYTVERELKHGESQSSLKFRRSSFALCGVSSLVVQKEPEATRLFKRNQALWTIPMVVKRGLDSSWRRPLYCGLVTRSHTDRTRQSIRASRLRVPVRCCAERADLVGAPFQMFGLLRIPYLKPSGAM